MPIKAIACDFGNVLVRTEDFTLHRLWEEKLHIPTGEILKVLFGSSLASLATIGAISPKEVWQNIGNEFQLDEQQLFDLEQALEATDFLDNDLAFFLHSLRPVYRTAILSNAWLGARDVFVNKYGLHNFVDEIIISAEEGKAKPDAVLFQVTLTRLNVKPEEMIFIDDLEENVLSAKKLGIHGIVYQSTDQVLSEVEALLKK